MASFFPSPEERADMVVRKLEQTIRDTKNQNKSSGMSFKKWQDVARVEVADAIKNSVLDEVQRNRGILIFWVLSGTCLTTLGFLGVAVSWGSMDKMIAGSIGIGTGLLLLLISLIWVIKDSAGKVVGNKRAAQLARLNNIDAQIKKMERYLEDRKGTVKNEMDF